MRIKINDDQSTVYPYRFAQLRADFPNIGFPDPIDGADLAFLGVHSVVPTDPPARTAGNKVVEGVPTLVDGIWTQTWAQVALTADEIAEQANAARLAEVDTNIAADSTVAQLKAMTVAEFDTWWAANVTNAAQAINVLKRVTRIVIRRVL